MVDTDTFVVIGIVAAVLAFAWLLKRPSKSRSSIVTPPQTKFVTPTAAPPDPGEEAAVRRAFANVFSMLTRPRQEDLVQNWMRAKGCSRIEAMRGLLKDRGIDEVKYDS